MRHDTKSKKGHNLCNTVHPPGKCPQVCKHCGKKGSHLEDHYWEKYPELKAKYTPRKRKEKEEKKERKSRSSRSREKSLEKYDRRTKVNSPHPEGRVGRVAREEFPTETLMIQTGMSGN